MPSSPPSLTHPSFLPTVTRSLIQEVLSAHCMRAWSWLWGRKWPLTSPATRPLALANTYVPVPDTPPVPQEVKCGSMRAGLSREEGVEWRATYTRASLRAKGFHTGDRLCSQPHGHSGLKRWDGGHQSPWTEERQPCQGLGLPAMPPFPTTVPHLCSSRKCNCDSPLGAMASNPCNHNKPPSPSGCLHP